MSERDEILERRSRLKQLILTLEWDKSHNQIHAGHDNKLKEYKTELEAIEKEITGGIMARNYKELRNCRMCKKRFVVPKKSAVDDYQELFYCKDCYKKFFPKEEE